MVDQTEMKPTNGHTDLPPRAVAREPAEFLHDLTILAELHAKLLVVDCRQGMDRLILPTAALAAGIALALGCVPVAMGVLTLTLMETTTLSPAQSSGIALIAGMVLASVVTGAAIWWLRRDRGVFDRSSREFRHNFEWAKATLKHMGTKSGGSSLLGRLFTGHTE
jgi:hypothetical protein